MNDEGEDEDDDIEGNISDLYVYVQSTTTTKCVKKTKMKNKWSMRDEYKVRRSNEMTTRKGFCFCFFLVSFFLKKMCFRSRACLFSRGRSSFLVLLVSFPAAYTPSLLLSPWASSSPSSPLFVSHLATQAQRWYVCAAGPTKA